MWNLTADDVQRAKEELNGRRAAIQARYENELKQLEVDIADLAAFESFAVKFVSDYKGEEPAEALVVEPAPEIEVASVAASIVAEAANSANPDNAEVSGGDKVESVVSVDNAVRKSTSRWRMHLSGSEASA